MIHEIDRRMSTKDHVRCKCGAEFPNEDDFAAHRVGGDNRFWLMDDVATDRGQTFEAGLVDEEAGGIVAYFLGWDKAVEISALLNKATE